MNNKYFLVLLIISLFSINQVSYGAIINSQKEAGYISLNASKVKEVSPNIARVSFAVENTAINAQTASSENNKISNQIITALKQVTKEDTDVIKTNNFSIRPVYTTNKNGTREIKNYIAVNSITVETKDTSKISLLIDTAISNGANSTNGLSYSFENDNSMCMELYPELIKEIKNEALKIAQASGETLDGIRRINASCNIDSVVSNGRFYANSFAAMDSKVEESVPSTPVEAGKAKVRVYIDADFYVK